MSRVHPASESFTFRHAPERRQCPEPTNPAWMAEQVLVERIGSRTRGFTVAGRPVTYGEVVSVETFLARSLAAQGKCRILVSGS